MDTVIASEKLLQAQSMELPQSPWHVGKLPAGETQIVCCA
jgi:hypothetical protein